MSSADTIRAFVEGQQNQWLDELKEFLRIPSISTDPDRADLTVDLAQVRGNTQFDPEVFLPVVPDDFGPVTLDELRSQPPTDDRAARLR